MKYVLLLATIGSMAAGQILFKIASREGVGLAFVASPIFISAVFLYGLTTIIWIFALRQWPLSIAYPATALSIAIVVSCGAFLFDEVLSPKQLAAICLIVVGVVTLAAS